VKTVKNSSDSQNKLADACTKLVEASKNTKHSFRNTKKISDAYDKLLAIGSMAFESFNKYTPSIYLANIYFTSIHPTNIFSGNAFE